MTPDPIEAAARRLPREVAAKALDDIARWIDFRQTILDQLELGVRVAPLYRRPLSEQMAYEASRRARIDDRSWTIWDAYSARLRQMEAQA
jgi:hypothetical protein